MLLLFILVLQVPFLNADPDLFLSHSRDAHSDEGLNTIQLRNYFHTGNLDPWECDNLMKNPLFNLALFLPFKIFGTKLLVGRITVLGFILAVLIFIGYNKKWRVYLGMAIPITFLQFHVFQYMHFSLAETMAIGCILLGMFSLVNMWDEENTMKKIFWLILGCSSLIFSWMMKVQFLYINVLLSLYLLIYVITKIIKDRRASKNTLWVLGVSVFVSGIWMLLYYKFWYLRYKEPFEYIMLNQTSGRFDLGKYFWPIIGENLTRYFSTQYVKPLWICFIPSLCISIFVWIKAKNKFFNRLFLFQLLWFAVELHKISIHHVPSRYLLSAYVVMLSVIATALYGLYLVWKSNSGILYRWMYALSLGGILFLTGTHLYNYSVAYNRRTFHVRDLNNYMEKYAKDKKVALGPWASTITWNTNIKTLPVWKDFLNYKDIKNTFHPDIVVTEPGEADSDGAFCADNFDIVNEADSVKMTWIGKWPVHIYWMKK